MPAYHSSYKDVSMYQPFCNTVALPLKTVVKGPAPPCPPEQSDIVDEAIEFFRANILFKSFSQEGPADLLLCYLIIYFSEILRFLDTGSKTLTDAKKNIITLSMSNNFNMPGDENFCLPGFFAAPANRAESELARQYFYQLRQEAANRFLPLLYNADGTQNKWWFMFKRRKFMNVDRT